MITGCKHTLNQTTVHKNTAYKLSKDPLSSTITESISTTLLYWSCCRCPHRAVMHIVNTEYVKDLYKFSNILPQRDHSFVQRWCRTCRHTNSGVARLSSDVPELLMSQCRPNLGQLRANHDLKETHRQIFHPSQCIYIDRELYLTFSELI